MFDLAKNIFALESSFWFFNNSLLKRFFLKDSLLLISLNLDNENNAFADLGFILIVFTHRKNILNLKNKTETKIKL